MVYPLRVLMAGIVICGVAFVALRTASDLWLSAIYSLSVLVLLVAVLAARFRRGAERAFWHGFAVFGWAVFLLGKAASRRMNAFRVDQGLNPNLVTSRIIVFLVSHWRKDTNDLGEIARITTNTVEISHLMVTLGLACAGGGLAAWLWSRRRARMPRAGRTTAAISVGLLAMTGLIAMADNVRHPRYFPDWAVDREKGFDDFQVKWYSRELAAMGERPLWHPGRDTLSIRLLWLPSFHHSICVRIDRLPEAAELRVRLLDGNGGQKPGALAMDWVVRLREDQWADVVRRVQLAGFWKMPTMLEAGDGTDGDQLLIEGVEGGVYHVVERWIPDPAFAGLAHAMLGLTGIALEKTWDEYHHGEDPEPEPPGPALHGVSDVALLRFRLVDRGAGARAGPAQ